MRSYLFILLFTIGLVNSSILFAGKKNQTNLHQNIINEFEKFKKLAKIDNIKMGELIFSKSEEDYSHTSSVNYDITINEGQIAKYVADSSDLFQSMFIKFVIAHEMGHNMQISGYKQDVLKKANGEGLIFLECDADVIAGLLMTQVINSIDIPDLVAKNENTNMYSDDFTNNIMFSVYNQVYKMDKASSTKTHPDNIDRLMAIRQGFILGKIIAYYYILNSPSSNGHNLSESDRKNVLDVYNVLVKGIGFDPSSSNNSNPFLWASDEAIRIIHENNSLARNVVMFDKDISWDENSEHPYVNFSARILNENTKSVRFSGYIFTELVPRDNPKNIIRVAPTDGQPFDLIIDPGQAIDISCKLKWIADKNYEPHIVVPGDSRSLYWVFDANKPATDTTNVKTFDVNLDEWDATTLPNIYLIINSLKAQRSDLFAYTRGIGITTANTPLDIESGEIIYQPTFKNGEKDDQTIIVRKKSNTIYYQFKIGKPTNKDIASEHFDELINYIKIKFPNYSFSDLAEGTTDRLVAFHNNGNKMLRILMQREIGNDNFTIEIQIAGT